MLNTNQELLITNIEAMIFASETPLSIPEINEVLNQIFETIIDSNDILNCIERIKEKYSSLEYSFCIVNSGGGYQFLTKKEYHKALLRLKGDNHIKKLSNSAMETLSIIAYKQPITKSEIEYIRGVNADYGIQKLLEKELIVIVGRKEDAIGKPLLYSTSKYFMDYLGINSHTELPQLGDITDTEISKVFNGLDSGSLYNSI